MIYVVQLLTVIAVGGFIMSAAGPGQWGLAAGLFGVVAALVVTRFWLVWVRGARQVYDRSSRQYLFVFPGDPGYDRASWAFRAGQLLAAFFRRRIRSP
jgi:hypothetical protein